MNRIEKYKRSIALLFALLLCLYIKQVNHFSFFSQPNYSTETNAIKVYGAVDIHHFAFSHNDRITNLQLLIKKIYFESLPLKLFSSSNARKYISIASYNILQQIISEHTKLEMFCILRI